MKTCSYILIVGDDIQQFRWHYRQTDLLHPMKLITSKRFFFDPPLLTDISVKNG